MGETRGTDPGEATPEPEATKTPNPRSETPQANPRSETPQSATPSTPATAPSEPAGQGQGPEQPVSDSVAG